jgi:para-nitrobenzyl esterase
MDETEPVVRTAGGQVRGRTDDAVAIFRGIPFARPPVGGLRFAAPGPAEPWDGVRAATEFGPPPPQSRSLLTPPPPESGADPDDWLTVNVFSPDLGAAGLPVMVWIHGGAYRSGAASDPGYDGTLLARQNVVVVTFNHRVGVEGYAYLPGVPANRALLDQVAALRWVRENIAAFGGDPDRVTVFGESAGAGAIAALLVMPLAAGLFRRAIAQSVPGTFFSTALAADVTAAIAAAAGLPATAEAFAAADPARLAAASDAVRPVDHAGRWGRVAHTSTPFSPVVDGEVLPAAPWRALAMGAGRSIDLITGHNRDEFRLFTELAETRGRITAEAASHALQELAPSHHGGEGYRQAYPDADPQTLFELVNSDWLFRMPSLHLAQAHAAAGGRTFLYELSYPASVGGLGACHGIDVPLLFGVYAGLGQLFFGREPPASAVRLGDLMRSHWAAFAADGDPGWPQYSPGRRMTRIFADPPDVAPYPERTSLHLWDQHRFGVLDLTPDPDPDPDPQTPQNPQNPQNPQKGPDRADIRAGRLRARDSRDLLRPSRCRRHRPRADWSGGVRVALRRAAR